MATFHVVRQGECLSKIAAEKGFPDYTKIWDHPENAELKEKRKNPNILYPGDRVFIPDMETKEESASTEQRHRFRYSGSPLKLRMVLKDAEDEPIANTECVLQVGLERYELMTDGNGQVEQEIPRNATQGKLTIQGMEIVLKIGHLDPIEELTGWQARLNNLGYYAGDLGTVDEDQLRSAIEEFQCDYGLQVDGDCGINTQKKLKEIYGC